MSELAERTLSSFAGLLASTTRPLPAGGSSSAVAIALGAALIEMSSLVAGRHAREEDAQRLAGSAERAGELRRELLTLADRDVAAGRGTLLAADPQKPPAASVEVPLAIAAASSEVAEIGSRAADDAPAGVRADAVVGVLLADAAVAGAAEIVAANLGDASPDDPRLRLLRELAERAASARNRVWLPLSYRHALRSSTEGALPARGNAR